MVFIRGGKYLKGLCQEPGLPLVIYRISRYITLGKKPGTNGTALLKFYNSLIISYQIFDEFRQQFLEVHLKLLHHLS